MVRFSVLIPVYNHQKYVKQTTISALRSPLVAEVVLVDDGSADGSAEVIAAFAASGSGRIRDLTRQAEGNRGAHFRLNQLVEAAQCEWLAVLNSDDLFVNRRFEKIIAHERFAQSDFVFGNMLLMNEHGTLIGAKRGPFDTGTPFPATVDVGAMVMSNNLIGLLAHQNFVGTTSNMLFTKKLHASIGGFSSYRYVHDWDFALRAMMLGRCLYIQKFITTYRYHQTNTIYEASEGSRKLKEETARVFEAVLSDFPALERDESFQTCFQQNVDLTT